MVLSEVLASWWRSGGRLNVWNDMRVAVSRLIEVARTTVPAGTSPALLCCWPVVSIAQAVFGCVHSKVVPSVQMQCRMTANLRAIATFAFLAPDRFISLIPQALSGDHR